MINVMLHLEMMSVFNGDRRFTIAESHRLLTGTDADFIEARDVLL